MLNMPMRKASATPSPAAMSGVANVSVSVSGLIARAKVGAPKL